MTSIIIQTHSGRAVDIRNPDPESIDIGDIAWSLSQQCRFNGHSARFYSVAEHCTRGAWLAAGHGNMAQRAFLLHDASEAYLCDLPTPLKDDPALGAAYRAIEGPLQAAIYTRFGVQPVEKSVGIVDRLMLALEIQQGLMGEPLVGGWPDEVYRPVPVFSERQNFGWGCVSARDRFRAVAADLGIGQ